MSTPNLLESLTDNIVIDKDKCTFCGICVERCILDNLRLQLAPCRAACPLGVNCQGYVQLIARGQEEEARREMYRSLPFPEILGRVCSQPCEDACHRRQMEGQAVAIRALKRYLMADAQGAAAPLPEMAPASGRWVAVVGAGPAGLMAAHDLRCRGHAVVVIDGEAEPGGMLRWAIPEFRLPREALERELDLLRRMGVEFHCGVRLGDKRSLESLKEEYDAVLLALGCQAPVRLGLSGEDLDGVFHGLDFLRAVRRGEKPVVGERVVVIGGGNVAVDVAQTSLRLGAGEVVMACLESREEMPAFAWELEGALAEGVRLECRLAPAEIKGRGGRVHGVEFMACLSVFDEQGAFSPTCNPDNRRSLPADTVILAVGQRRSQSDLEAAGLAGGLWREVDPLTLQTGDPKLFAAGDLVSGPGSVVEAMAAGRRAAESIHRYLSGEDLVYGRRYAGPVESDFEIDTSRGSDLGRTALNYRRAAGPGDFGEVELPLSRDAARKEASRCYSCGQPVGRYRTCWFCLPCEVECPHQALWVEVPYLLR